MSDYRLAIPAAAGWVAGAIVIGMPALLPSVVLWSVAAVVTVLALRWRRAGLIALALAAAALCCTSVAVQAPQRQPVELLDAGAVTVTGVTTETVLPGGRSFGLTATSVDGTVVRVPMLVFGAGSERRLGIGTTVSLVGRLAASEPGDDVSFILFPSGDLEVVAAPPWYLDWADGLRATFLKAATDLPGEGGELLAGLAIGDTSAVDESLQAAMKTSSLTHLTAVSGANCAIVIGLIMAGGAALGLRRAVRIAASVVVLVGFVVLVTPEPSVLRAAVMAALVLVALGLGRPVSGLPVLSLATLSLLVADPWLARNYGFVLSVLATAGLLLLAGPLARVLERWLPRWLALVIAVPVAAQLTCQPVIILLDASLPTYGVVANLLAAPAAPLATVVGLAACVLLATVPPLGQLLCQLAWFPSAWIAAVAQFFAGLPAARLPWPPGALGVALLVVVSALALVAVLRPRLWAALAFALVVALYVGVIAGSRVATQFGRPDWQIAACDIGQGDAVLVRSADRVALIDTGPDPAPLRQCLNELGIGRLDLLVLTHYDLDHVGGVAAVVGRADRVFVGPSGEASDDRIVADLVAGGADVQQVSRGLTGLLGDERFAVLWPPTRPQGLEPGNESSVTVQFTPVGTCASGCLSSLFLGDLGEDAQDRVLAANPQLSTVDVVKVSHHGSADQSSRLYERIAAAVGVISVGADNGYGHPTDRLLEILERVGTVAERTDQHGLILLAPGDAPGTVTVWTSR